MRFINLKKPKLNIKPNKRGSSLILVLVTLAIISIFSALVLVISLAGLQMKVTNLRSDENFYRLEQEVDELYTEVGIKAAKVFSEEYVELVQSSAMLQESFVQNCFARFSRINGADEIINIVDIHTPEDGITVEHGEAVQDVENGKFIIKDVKVTYTNEKGYSEKLYNSITTDIVITVPQVSSIDESRYKALFQYIYVTNGDINISGSHMADGNIYAGKNIVVGEHDADNVSLYSNFIAAYKNITLKNGILDISGSTDIANIWADNIIADSKAQKAELTLTGNTYVKDNLQIDARNSIVSIFGNYYGWGAPSVNIGLSDGTGSSAILVNGQGATLDLSGLSELIINGRAFFQLNPNEEPQNVGKDTTSLPANAVAQADAELPLLMSADDEPVTLLALEDIPAEDIPYLVSPEYFQYLKDGDTSAVEVSDSDGKISTTSALALYDETWSYTLYDQLEAGNSLIAGGYDISTMSLANELGVELRFVGDDMCYVVYVFAENDKDTFDAAISGLALDAPHVIYPEPATVHTITATAGANGTISPSGIVSVNGGENKTFTITPNQGYRINTILVDGSPVTVSSSYTFTGVSANHTIGVTFAEITHTITATVGANGTISPSGNVSVNDGTNKTFTITPASGYGVDTLTVDGAPVAAALTYTFTNVTANHTISVTFKRVLGIPAEDIPYLVRPEYFQYLYDGDTSAVEVSDSDGKISTTSAFALYDETWSYTLYDQLEAGNSLIAGGYDISTMSLANELGVELRFVGDDMCYVVYVFAENDKDTFDAAISGLTLDDPHVIYPLAPTTHTITASAVGNGTISPSGNVSVNGGQSMRFDFTPSSSTYQVSGLKIDGDSVTPAAYYIFNNVNADHTIEVTFSLKTYPMTLERSASYGKVLDGSTELPVSNSWTRTHGTTKAFTLIPDTNCEIDYATLNSNDITLTPNGSGGYTFTTPAISSAQVIRIGFKKTQYKITVNVVGALTGGVKNNDGSYTSSYSYYVDKGTPSSQIAFKAYTGYTFKSLLSGATDISGTVNTSAAPEYTCTLAQATQDVIITITFEKIKYAVTTNIGYGGSISPSGAVMVEHGSAPEFTLTLEPGYKVDRVELTNNSTSASTTLAWPGNKITLPAVTANMTLSVTVSAIIYDISVTIKDNKGVGNVGGTLVNGTQGSYRLSYNSPLSLQFSPDDGYELDKLIITANGETQNITSGWTVNGIVYKYDTKVTSDMTVQIIFKLKKYALTLSQINNATVTPSMPAQAEHGSDVTLVFTPENGYQLASLNVGGNNVLAQATLSGGKYSIVISNITAPIDVKASFTPITYTIGYTLNGGSATNPTTYNVTTASFTLVNPTRRGYNFAGWTGTGLSGAVTSVTVPTGSYGNRAYTATWNPKNDTPYKVEHYKMDLDGSTYVLAETQNLTGRTGATVTPAAKTYTGFTSNGTQSLSILADGSRVFKYYYTRNQYSVTFTLGTGIATTIGGGTYYYGASVTANATIKTGYEWSKWTYTNGTQITTNQMFTFTMPAYAVTYIANATKIKVTITASAGEHGSISPAGSIIVEYGDNKKFTFDPDDDYRVSKILVDGEEVQTGISYTLSNITSAHTIHVEFTMITYTVTASVSGGGIGTISPIGDSTVVIGDSVTYNIVPDVGDDYEKLIIDGIDQPEPLYTYEFTNVRENHSIEAVLKKKHCVLTVKCSADNGTVFDGSTPLGTNNTFALAYGDSKTLTIVPDTNCEVDYVRINGSKVTITSIGGGRYTYTTPAIESEQLVEISFRKIQHQVTVNVADGTLGSVKNAGGTYSASAVFAVDMGASKQIEFKANTGSILKSLYLGETDKTSSIVTSNAPNYTFTVGNVTDDVTITITFKKIQYTVTANTGTGITLDASINSPVEHGSTPEYTFTLAYGYKIDSVTVKNNTTLATTSIIPNGNKITLPAVTANMTLTIVTSPISYDVTVLIADKDGNANSGGALGSSTYPSYTAQYNSKVSVTFTEAAGYETDHIEITVNGSTQSIYSGWMSSGSLNTYEFTVTAKTDVKIIFKHKTITVEVTRKNNAAVSPALSQTVNYGTSLTLYFTPDTGYELTAMTVNGSDALSQAVFSSGKYGITLNNITSNIDIKSTFSKIKYSVTAAAGAGGSVTDGASQTVEHGSNATFRFTANSGYSLSTLKNGSITIDSGDISVSGNVYTYTLRNVTANAALTATFSKRSYTVSASVSGGHGTISVSGGGSVTYGNSVTLTITADAGYTIKTLRSAGGDLPFNGTAPLYTCVISNVTSDMSITVTFGVMKYNVESSVSGEGGFISPSGVVSVNYGGTQKYTISPATGYEIASVTVDTVAQGAISEYTFNNVSANHTIVAMFRRKRYNIEVTSAGSGTVTPYTGTVLHGENATYTFIPSDDSYMVSSVVVDGHALASFENSYTFTNVVSEHTLNVTFIKKTFSVTLSQPGHGRIEYESGASPVEYGGSVTVKVTPDIGYMVGGINANGNPQPVTGNNPYYCTINNITANTTVTAVIAEVAYNVKIETNGSGGTVSPSGSVTVAENGNLLITVTPHAGYKFTAKVGSTDVTALFSGNKFTLENIIADKTVSITFSKFTYQIVPSTAGNGSIDPATTQAVEYGTSKTFNFVPNNGYEVDKIYIDNIDYGNITSYTFSSVTANHTVRATFKKKEYTFTINVGVHGTVIPGNGTKALYGESLELTITPEEGYVVDVLNVDGTVRNYNAYYAVSNKQTKEEKYLFTNIAENHSVTVSFKARTHKIKTEISGNGGSITPAAEQTVAYGADSAEYVLNSGSAYLAYAAVIIDDVETNITDTVKANGNKYKITGVKSDCTLKAIYTPSAQIIVSAYVAGGVGGRVTPSGAVAVANGASKTYTFTAEDGYVIDSITDSSGGEVNDVIGTVVDGKPTDTRTYTISAVTSSHTINVRFKKKTISVTVQGNGADKNFVHGTVNGSAERFNINAAAGGGNTVLTITPENGYDCTEVLVGAESRRSYLVASGGGYKLTLTNINETNSTVTVIFAQRTQTIKLTENSGSNKSASDSKNANITITVKQYEAFRKSGGYYILCNPDFTELTGTAYTKTDGSLINTVDGSSISIIEEIEYRKLTYNVGGLPRMGLFRVSGANLVQVNSDGSEVTGASRYILTGSTLQLLDAGGIATASYTVTEREDYVKVIDKIRSNSTIVTLINDMEYGKGIICQVTIGASGKECIVDYLAVSGYLNDVYTSSRMNKTVSGSGDDVYTVDLGVLSGNLDIEFGYSDTSGYYRTSESLALLVNQAIYQVNDKFIYRDVDKQYVKINGTYYRFSNIEVGGKTLDQYLQLGYTIVSGGVDFTGIISESNFMQYISGVRLGVSEANGIKTCYLYWDFITDEKQEEFVELCYQSALGTKYFDKFLNLGSVTVNDNAKIYVGSGHLYEYKRGISGYAATPVAYNSSSLFMGAYTADEMARRIARAFSWINYQLLLSSTDENNKSVVNYDVSDINQEIQPYTKGKKTDPIKQFVNLDLIKGNLSANSSRYLDGVKLLLVNGDLFIGADGTMKVSGSPVSGISVASDGKLECVIIATGSVTAENSNMQYRGMIIADGGLTIKGGRYLYDDELVDNAVNTIRNAVSPNEWFNEENESGCLFYKDFYEQYQTYKKGRAAFNVTDFMSYENWMKNKDEARVS